MPQRRIIAAILIAMTAGAPLAAAKTPPRIRVDRGRHGFCDAAGKPFVPFGVTYYRPGTGWAPQLWKQFDAEATRRDFHALKIHGANVVRVFASFGSFFTEPGKLNAEGLAAFDRLLDLADEAGLYVHPTGPDAWEGTPAWTKDMSFFDIDANPPSLRALENYWRWFAGRYRGRTTIWAYDLRNEPHVAWDSPHLRTEWATWRKSHQEQPAAVPGPNDTPPSQALADYQRFRESTAATWVARQSRAIHAADPEALATVGLIQWSVPAQRIAIDQYSGFRPTAIAPQLDFMELHYYPLVNGVYDYRDTRAETENLAVLEAMARECARPGLPLVIAEFGWYGGGALYPHGKPATEDQQAEWCRRLVEVTSPLACGWLNWGQFDEPQAADVSRLTGLFTVDGKQKQWGGAFRDFARQYQADPPRYALPDRPDLPWAACTASGEEMEKFRQAYLKAFIACSLGTSCNGDETSSQREIVQRAMRDRPGDPWPRGTAHVLLAAPGSQQPEKAYYEPGGSFSPAWASFGLAIWVRDAAGTLKTTSDALPMAEIEQRFSWPDPTGIPAIVATTPYYQATWSSAGPGSTALDLAPRGLGRERLELVVRSVGPAGGPIERLDWDGQRLTINGAWTLTVVPRPAAVWMGHEGDPNWTSQQTHADRWTGTNGWGYARIELPRGAACRILLHASARTQPNPLRCPSVRGNLQLKLPDPRFADCLHAQAAHLLMGLLDRRTPPGDPTNYPLAWQRDGVAVVAGLLRAGQTDVARQLAEYFAENDFFGGFGAEGDAPGQGLRVLEDVAVRLHDPAFDRWLWPHVERKAGLILKMAVADRPLRMPYAGPIVPQHRNRGDLDLVCEAAHDGLIAGRMDFGLRTSYITAVSYSGLRGAAALARRLDHRQQADRWQQAADGLQKAWLRNTEWSEDRTYISGLWPTLVAAPEKSTYRTQLTLHSNPQSFLPWTYFSAAAAHQWVFFDEPDRAWESLEWFWSHQTSPGLYTWWEGNGEENTFHLWEKSRGWVRPPYVTPHYWTAGEVLAMQADILAYVDPSQAEPVLVIGGGIPRSWIGRTMRVAGLPTSAGLVDWSWNEGRMHVTVHGQRIPVRLGQAFGPAARVDFLQLPRGRL